MVLGASLGGAWGGAIVGLAESSLLTCTSTSPEEYWLFPYAAITYGLLGLLFGLFYAIAAALRAAISTRGRHDTFGGAAALALFALGGAVVRYHVIQRVFHEQLISTSGTGLAVHTGVVGAVGALALLLNYAGRLLQRTRWGLLSAAAGLIICLGISSGAAVLASVHTAAPPMNRIRSAAAGSRPNIILIVADTLRADALGSYGAGANATPALDGFGAEGVRFASAFSQSTWTRPSIATILTSLYPSTHGAIHKMDTLPDHVTTLAEALQAQGYWTAGFVSNINVAPVFNFQQGFAEYTYLPPDFYFWATDSVTQLAIYKGLRVVRERFFGHRIYFNHYYQDAAVVNAAVSRWLDEGPPRPFFLFIHYMDPHDPYFEHPYNGRGVARVIDPDPPASRKDEMHRLYTEDVSYLDNHLGVLFDRLKVHGVYDDSIIAITADHGEEFQEHGGWWHGTTLFEELVHIPLMIKRAHEPQPGTVESRTARTLDIAPTLMATAGLRAPDTFAGHDLFGQARAGEEPLFAEEDLEGNVLASLRIGSWKLITANPGNPRRLEAVELYDLNQDPNELQNRARSEPARLQEMTRLLAQEQARLGTQGSGRAASSDAADRRS
jgi:arylsulfatase A-like enzyme